MKKEIPAQLYVGLGIVLIGGAILGVEYFWVKLAPVHKQHVEEETLKLVPYKNDGLGIDMQVAAGIYGKVESFAGGVKIYQTRFWGEGPSLTITSEPNVDHSTEFSQEILAKWETDGVLQGIPRYHFDHTKIDDRDAVILQRYKNRAMETTAHIISPDRIIVADCSTGGGDPALLVEACDETVRSIKIAGPKPSLEDAGKSDFTPPKVIPKR